MGASTSSPIHLGATLDVTIRSEIRREMELSHFKWDAQVGDVSTLAPFPFVLEASTLAGDRNIPPGRVSQRVGALPMSPYRTRPANVDLAGLVPRPRRSALDSTRRIILGLIVVGSSIALGGALGASAATAPVRGRPLRLPQVDPHRTAAARADHSEHLGGTNADVLRELGIRIPEPAPRRGWASGTTRRD